MRQKILVWSGVVMMTTMLSACGADTVSQPVASPVSLQTPPAFENSLDDVSLDDPLNELDKIARNLDIDTQQGSDTVPNFAKDLDSIQWEDIDSGLTAIQKQL